MRHSDSEMRHSDSELVTICRHELGRTAGSSMDDGNLTQNRRQAIEYYLARKPAGPSTPGRSQVISPDVRSAITNLSAEMTNLWAGEYPAEFEQESGDDNTYEAETYAVRQVLERCDLDTVLGDACHDAMLLKNGVIKAWVTDKSRRETRRLKDVSDAEVAQFMTQLPEDATVRWDGEDAIVEIPWEDRKVCVEAVDPTNFLVSQAVRSNDLEEARFLAERKFMTRSELIAMGFSKAKVNKLPAFSYDTKEDSYTRRLDYTTSDESAETRDQDRLEVYEAYLMIDLDGERGVSDRWRILFCEETLLEKVRVNYVPYVSGRVLNMPHRWEGISIFDLTKESQDVGTAAWRQWIDNNATAIQNRLVLGPGINKEDVSAAGPNRHIRMDRGDDVRMAAMPLPFNDVGPHMESMMAYKDKLRSESAGASAEMHGAEAQLLSSQVGSLGADRIMSSQEQVAAFFLRNFTMTVIKGLFLLVHRCLREDYGRPVEVRDGDNWGQSDPRTWRPRYAVAVRSGMSTGERNRKVGSLTTHLQVQMQLIQGGSPMASEVNVYRTLMDLARAQELESAEEYYTDPQSEAYQQAAQMRQAQQAQQMQMQAQIETLGDQVKMAIAQMQDATDRLKIAADMEMKEAEIVGKATTDLSLKRLEAENAGAPGGDSGGNNPTPRQAAG